MVRGLSLAEGLPTGQLEETISEGNREHGCRDSPDGSMNTLPGSPMENLLAGAKRGRVKQT